MTTNLQTPMLQHPDVTAPTVTPFPAQIANFNLIQATNRRSDKAPHYFGYFKMPDGQWYSVSTWIQFAKNSGQQLLNNSIRPCTPEEAAKQEAYAAQFQQQSQRPVQTVATSGNPLHAGAPVENPVETQGIPPEVTSGHPF